MGYDIKPMRQSNMPIYKLPEGTQGFGLIRHPFVVEGVLGEQRAGIVVVEIDKGKIIAFEAGDYNRFLQ